MWKIEFSPSLAIGFPEISLTLRVQQQADRLDHTSSFASAFGSTSYQRYWTKIVDDDEMFYTQKSVSSSFSPGRSKKQEICFKFDPSR